MPIQEALEESAAQWLLLAPKRAASGYLLGSGYHLKTADIAVHGVGGLATVVTVVDVVTPLYYQVTWSTGNEVDRLISVDFAGQVHAVCAPPWALFYPQGSIRTEQVDASITPGLNGLVFDLNVALDLGCIAAPPWSFEEPERAIVRVNDIHRVGIDR